MTGFPGLFLAALTAQSLSLVSTGYNTLLTNLWNLLKVVSDNIVRIRKLSPPPLKRFILYLLPQMSYFCHTSIERPSISTMLRYRKRPCLSSFLWQKHDDKLWKNFQILCLNHTSFIEKLFPSKKIVNSGGLTKALKMQSFYCRTNRLVWPMELVANSLSVFWPRSVQLRPLASYF